MILDFEDKLSSLLTLTIAKRLLQPLTFVGMLLNFWSNASEILWAGSVEIISTLSLVWASWRAILQLQKKKRKDYCFVKLNRTQSYLLDTVCLKEQWCQIILFKEKLDLKRCYISLNVVAVLTLLFLRNNFFSFMI